MDLIALLPGITIGLVLALIVVCIDVASHLPAGTLIVDVRRWPWRWQWIRGRG